MENLGVATGFPFGPYVFTGAMGPRIFAVPVLLGLAYIGMAWASWQIASAILGPVCVAAPLRRSFTVPVTAAFAMTAWDSPAEDPVLEHHASRVDMAEWRPVVRRPAQQLRRMVPHCPVDLPVLRGTLSALADAPGRPGSRDRTLCALRGRQYPGGLHACLPAVSFDAAWHGMAHARHPV